MEENFNENLPDKKLRRQPQSSITIRHFCKRKSCCHVIVISQAGIVAPTLTLMQGFQGKKERAVHLLSHFSFSFLNPPRISIDRDGWKKHALTTRLHQSQRCHIKMPYLNQMHEKKAIEGYA